MHVFSAGNDKKAEIPPNRQAGAAAEGHPQGEKRGNRRLEADAEVLQEADLLHGPALRDGESLSR